MGLFSAVSDELAKRQALDTAIDAVLERYFEFGFTQVKVRIRRGVVHDLVAQKLGMALSIPMHIAIRRRVEARGGYAYKIVGRAFYKNICLK